MRKKWLAWFSIVTILLVFFVFSTYEQSKSTETDKDEVYYNQLGLNYFKEGFYNLMPKGRKEEAMERYEQAMREFKKAIALNENHVEAHLNLARVYSVQKRFAEAAEVYRKVTQLTPQDINIYVKLAIVYGRMNKYCEAKEQLEKAKTFTTHKVVVNHLDSFIQKLEEEREVHIEKRGRH